MTSSKIARREYKELTIPLLYGNIAAKWWEPYNVKPIVALHGWHDNSGTFDTLIPLLPNHVGYLAIDFPGHGRSDRYPDGIFYGISDYVYILHQIVVKFDWTKVTVLGHSLGAVIGLFYAATWPDRCTAIIALDIMQPPTGDAVSVKNFLHNFDKLLVIDQQNQLQRKTPTKSIRTFTYAEMIEKICMSHNISAEFAPFLLERNISRMPTEDRYRFSNDKRLDYLNWIVLSHDMNLWFSSRITCPHLYIRALNYPSFDDDLHYNETLKLLETNPLFEAFFVDGGHHVHLVDAGKVSGRISEFIRKYYGSSESTVAHKL